MLPRLLTWSSIRFPLRTAGIFLSSRNGAAAMIRGPLPPSTRRIFPEWKRLWLGSPAGASNVVSPNETTAACCCVLSICRDVPTSPPTRETSPQLWLSSRQIVRAYKYTTFLYLFLAHAIVCVGLCHRSVSRSSPETTARELHLTGAPRGVSPLSPGPMLCHG